MKNYKFKWLLLSFILSIASINQVWAQSGFWTDNAWDFEYYNGSSNVWHGAANLKDNDRTVNLGVLTSFYLKGCWVKTYSNNNYYTQDMRWHYGIGDGSHDYFLNYGWANRNPGVWNFNNGSHDFINYDVIGEAPNNPGENTMWMYWELDKEYHSGQAVTSKTCYVNFTIPGFKKTNVSHTFANTTVSSTKDETISFTQHYGTTLTTSNCALTGDNKTEFEVRSISETGVTVRFKPSSDGNKSATLTITDAHSKTCTIALSGKTQRTVTYSKGTYGTGSNRTANKVYNETLQLADKGYFTRTGYHQTGWNTNASGSGGTSYALKGNYTSNSAVTLFPEWTINTYTIAFSANDENYPGPEATGTTASIAATYGVSYTLTTNGFSKEGYTFNGWSQNADGTGTQYTDGQSGISNLTTENEGTATLYAKWTGHTYTVTFNPRGGTNLNHHDATVTMGALYTAGTGLGGALPTVTAPTGYVFAGWYTAAKGGDKIDESSKVATPSDHTLYAHYEPKAQVYFKNTLGWSKVYVVYDAAWNNTTGTGSSGKTYRAMTLVPGTTDLYYDDIPDGYIASWAYNIAFNDKEIKNATFNSGHAVFRMDFDSKATMFVPTSETRSGYDGNYTKNGVIYQSTGYADGSSANPQYNSGYWKVYNDTYSGYTLTYQKKNGAWTSGIKMCSSSADDNTYVYTVHMDANSQYNFAFYKECTTSNTKSRQFRYGSEINSGACTNLKLVCYPDNAWMKTTVAGDYTFKLTMKNDGHMYLTIDYPLYSGDYKVVYSYTKGSAQTFESEIIKCRANGKDTISMFIHSGDSATSRALTIYKCTGINASGVATWNTSYATIALPDATASGKTSGVYDFIISQNGSAAASGQYWKKYDGNYYIRTYVSDGGWDLYKYRTDNVMKLSEYSMTQTLSAPYSHYYCRYVESTSADITYTVATDYSPKICPIMTGDATIGVGNRTLPSGNPANIRFSWNEETNATRRAYLKSAQGVGNSRYLVLHGSDTKLRDANGSTISAAGDLQANELQFTDIGNWVYQVDLQAQPGAEASLIAKYNGSDRYLIGGASSYMTLIGGTGATLYTIKAVYDFKTNRLMTAWTPSGAITDQLSNVDVLLLRYKQNSGTAITFSGSGSLTTKEIIGAIKLDYDDMVGHVGASSWTRDMREKLKYFISFPFDVNVSDIFGLNSAYGDAYVIQRYAGDERASKGFFRGDGTTTFWKDMAPGDVMKANEGYCVILDNDYFNGDMGNIWDNKAAGSSVYLYFPSDGNVGDISSENQTISILEHECKIERTFTSTSAGGREVSHKNTDSHWNMMGVPVFADHSDNGVSGEPGGVFADLYGDDNDFNYFFEWSPSTNQFSVRSAKNYTFRSMHSYMVQYHGKVTFVGSHPGTPASVAAHKAPQKENYQIELQVLNSDADVLNRAYVELRENACDTFALNEDVYMSYNSRPVNIYTLAGNYDVAANVLSINDHTIPVGLEVTKAGTYRITMPSNFSGEVTLLDTFTGESTNLALEDFEVTLPKGVVVDRFFLKINIKKVATAIDGVEDGSNTLKNGKAHKFIENGQMYILQNGVIYDAQGKRVK